MFLAIKEVNLKRYWIPMHILTDLVAGKTSVCIKHNTQVAVVVRNNNKAIKTKIKVKDINTRLVLRVPPIIAPRFLWGDRTILDCELYQTLFGAGAYTESDKALRGREVWSRKTKGNGKFTEFICLHGADSIP